MKSLALLGRQPALGLAELESLYGATRLQPVPGGAVLVDIAPEQIAFSRLGGVIKICEVIDEIASTDWPALEKALLSTTARLESTTPDGKITLGISVVGLGVGSKPLERTALTIKKQLKATGRPVRIVPNKSPELSTPQVLHNKLTSENGWELLLYRNGTKTLLTRTRHIQDIDAYTARDQVRPMRDARVGMLPPKLAQTIINLATGSAEVQDGQVVLDAFCGTGVVLQEASLMGYDVYGTDIEPRMIEYSTANMHWLRDRFDANTNVRIEVGDATSFTWKQPITTIAGEGYLGLPFAHLPSDAQLQESIHSSNTIAKGFLRNAHKQLHAGARICIALPAWHIKNRVTHLPCLSQLKDLGWERVAFVHAQQDELVYHRDDQIVGRELVVLVRK